MYLPWIVVGRANGKPHTTRYRHLVLVTYAHVRCLFNRIVPAAFTFMGLLFIGTAIFWLIKQCWRKDFPFMVRNYYGRLRMAFILRWDSVSNPLSSLCMTRVVGLLRCPRQCRWGPAAARMKGSWAAGPWPRSPWAMQRARRTVRRREPPSGSRGTTTTRPISNVTSR